MGHKINPTGFRIGVNKNWSSIWYKPKSEYADTAIEDHAIRKFLKKKLGNAGVAKVLIKRSMNKVMIELMVSRPGVVIGKGGSGIEELHKALSKLTKAEVKISKVLEVKKPEIQATLIAENIASQCERRINPKRAALKAVEAAMATGLIKGIEVWVGGRINGAEIARIERVHQGTVPRHSLRADIDYAHAEGHVPSAGIHGVKVWVNKGEKHDYEIGV